MRRRCEACRLVTLATRRAASTRNSARRRPHSAPAQMRAQVAVAWARGTVAALEYVHEPFCWRYARTRADLLVVFLEGIRRTRLLGVNHVLRCDDALQDAAEFGWKDEAVQQWQRRRDEAVRILADLDRRAAHVLAELKGIKTIGNA